MVTKTENIEWVKSNEETVIGQLVLYHSPVDLAHLILHPEKWDDAVIEKIRKTLAKSEGQLKVEKQERKKAAARAKKAKAVESVKETDDEANLRLHKERAAESESLFTAKETSDLDDSELPD